MTRNKGIARLGTAILAIAWSSWSHATVTFDTAGTYVIDTPVNDNVLVDNEDTHVIVESTINGVINGFEPALRTWYGTAEIVGNGQVIADGTQNAIRLGSGYSAVWLRDQALVQGNIDMNYSPWYEEATAVTRLYLKNQAVVEGTITAGGYLAIEDQAVVTGGIGSPAFGNARIDVRGGTVAGSMYLSSYNTYVLDVSGGSILGGLRGIGALVNIEMTGGYMSGGIRTSVSVVGDIFGGQIDGGILIRNTDQWPDSQLTIGGGSLDADPNDWLLLLTTPNFSTAPRVMSTLDIVGGEFGYTEQGLGVFIDGWVNVDVWGQDLVYSNGWLSGYLQDGSWFNNPVAFGANYHGTFTIHNIP